MGKNRKPQQVVNQAHAESEDDACDTNVPTEFLTSDDFQVVQKRKHHSKKSPDNQEDKEFLPRSRNNSSRFADVHEAIGCHSSFWAVKLGSEAVNGSAAEESGIDDCSSEKVVVNGTLNKGNDAIENGGGDGLPEIDLGLKKVNFCEPCIFGSFCAEELGELFLTSENALSIENGLKSDEKNESNVNGLKENLIDESESGLKTIKPNEKESHLFLQIGGTIDIDTTSTSENTSPVCEDNDGPKVYKLESNFVGTNSLKKREKRVRNKKKKSGDSTASQKTEIKVLTSSSSSDFSEVHTITNSKEHEKKEDHDHEKKDKKRPSKKTLAAIHEALRKAKEEEERRQQEEEARRKLDEEAERQAQERLKQEQDKKDKKKLKDKLKRERLRAEGRLLSKSQKQSRARLAATLEAFRRQGVDVPHIGDKKHCDTSNRVRLDSCQSDSSVISKSERHKSESLSSQGSSEKESLIDFPSSFDSKDSWDMNRIREAEALTTESDAGHFSCSEESDAPFEREDCARNPQVSEKIEESFEKVNLAKLSIIEAKQDSEKWRSPVICVLGHVDTGKTKLLDYIRKTHIQDSEAGGITQQIGATMIPQSSLKEKCKMVKDIASHELKVPGLLVIDTPGHESFHNLRSRGTSLCDIAILVVDIMHGLEPQTLESIDLLKASRIPFVVALNKVDRLYGWQSSKDEDIEEVISKQSLSTSMEFKKRCQEVILQFANLCLNAALFYENKDPRTFVSMVPTSAISGDGMGNLLSLITQLTQFMMHKQLIFSEELQATVLEVKVIPGLGTTIDVILVNGHLHEGDTVVLAGQEGPIVTQIRSILMPRPLKELRVKNPYVEYKTIEGAQGIKLTGKDFDKTIAGMPLFVAKNHGEIENFKSVVTDLLNQTVSCIKTSERGVYVQASTLGSLEALLEYLSSSSIPYFGVKVGPVVKKDVMKASIMLEHDKMYAAILAFDVKVEKDAQDLADSLGVKIFQANIIFHLYDMFVNYRDENAKKREEARNHAVYPCILKIVSGETSNLDGPLVLDVLVEAGTLRNRTPLCVSTKKNIDVGTVTSIEVDGASVQCAKEGQNARIFIETDEGDSPKVHGIDFDEEDYFVSRVTRQSIEVCKEYCRDELDESDWHLMNELKKMLHQHA